MLTDSQQPSSAPLSLRRQSILAASKRYAKEFPEWQVNTLKVNHREELNSHKRAPTSPGATIKA